MPAGKNGPLAILRTSKRRHSRVASMWIAGLGGTSCDSLVWQIAVRDDAPRLPQAPLILQVNQRLKTYPPERNLKNSYSIVDVSGMDQHISPPPLISMLAVSSIFQNNLVKVERFSVFCLLAILMGSTVKGSLWNQNLRSKANGQSCLRASSIEGELEVRTLSNWLSTSTLETGGCNLLV